MSSTNKTTKICKDVPKSETIWMEYHLSYGNYYISSNKDRSRYTAYKEVKNGYEIVGKSHDAGFLDKKICSRCKKKYED